MPTTASSAPSDAHSPDASSSTSFSAVETPLSERKATSLLAKYNISLIDSKSHVFGLLVAFRIFNALTIKTFFQPDEYFQALEPAWQLVFGEESGAWITWEWRYQLRSTIHPYLFAAVYWLAEQLASLLKLTSVYRAELLIVAPKVLQALLAAVADYYAWKLGELAHGEDSYGAWLSLFLTLFNPFHFFVVTRTLSNCLELTLTTVALYLWFTSAPDDPSITGIPEDNNEDKKHSVRHIGQERDDANSSMIVFPNWFSGSLDISATKMKKLVYDPISRHHLNRLRLCLLLAATVCTLRVTNFLIWSILASFEFFEYEIRWFKALQLKDLSIWLPRVQPKIRHMTAAHGVLIRESIFCGIFVLSMSAVLDRSYYSQWTFPPLNFLYFNVAEKVSDFYGVNDVLWYFTQGMPLLLGAFLPFTVQAIRQQVLQAAEDPNDFASVINYEFAAVSILVPLVFSLISHKEVRFIYPLIPILHVLSAGPAAHFFEPVLSKPPFSRTDKKSLWRYSLICGILFSNILAAIVVSQYHQCATLSVLDFLRREHEKHFLPQPLAITGLGSADTTMTVGFLMPCHSTPWRSHLIYPGIKGWALGCEPPLGMSTIEKERYRDEADEFYDNPISFLEERLGKPPKSGRLKVRQGSGIHGERSHQIAWDGRPGKKIWPDYLVFFAEKERLLDELLDGSDYAPCWRGWNSWFHDDWRRRGDVVVWCHKRPLCLSNNSHRHDQYQHH